ncbi:MAG: YqjF family protein [Chlorobiota bacterium]
MSFLKAEWRKLAIANYAIKKELLEEYIPLGTELDIWDGKCYVSLVGFMFINTKLLGVKIPFHSNFEEVNLRFYVKRLENGIWKRGVVFIKEIVPKHALSFIANTVYNENYITLPMKHSWVKKENSLEVRYDWKMSNKWNHIEIKTNGKKLNLEPNSETEFITEHYWGYAKVNNLKTNEYEVTHPRWEVYNVEEFTIDIDFGKIYGKKFSFLSNKEPDSVMLAEGSEITVENKKSIKK